MALKAMRQQQRSSAVLIDFLLLSAICIAIGACLYATA